jgi:hypothetical protein
MEVHAHVPHMGRSWTHWLLEGAFIVVSVLLAFGAGQWREQRVNRETAAHALRSIQTEIAANTQQLEPLLAWHSTWLAALHAADADRGAHDSAIEVWFKTRPDFPAGVSYPFPLLRRSAWDAAVNGGVMRLIDYDLSQRLSDVYGVQQIATSNVDRLANGPLALPTTFDPADRGPSVRLLWLTLADIQSAEAALLRAYKDAAPEIAKAVRAE